jgi:Carbohydrate binding domain (family 11)
VRLSVGRDASIPDQPVLMVEYPAPTNDPAGRDVQCAAQNQDWSRNRVAYTTWTELKGGVWQSVRIPFDEMRPNPYFQPSDAKTGSPIDVSDVKGIAFAPHDQTAGRLTIGKFVVSK